ncbi:MAG: ATP cone domain-containing protein, partial [Hylemonella sp.]
HCGYRVAGLAHVVEAGHDAARQLRLGHQLDGDLGGHGQHAFAADQHCEQVVAGAVERIEEKLLNLGLREVPSSRIGELVMRELKKLDKVAYVRFASVYRSFEDIDEFKTLVDEVRR